MSAIDPSMANANIVELSGTLMEVDNQDHGSESDGGDNDMDNGDNDAGEEAVGDVMPGDQLQDHDLGSQLGEREGTYNTGIQIGKVDIQTGDNNDARAHQCEVSIRSSCITSC